MFGPQGIRYMAAQFIIVANEYEVKQDLIDWCAERNIDIYTMSEAEELKSTNTTIARLLTPLHG